MVDKEYKWLYFYTFPCTIGNEELFFKLLKKNEIKNFFKGNYSRERVRDYFFEIHNFETSKSIFNSGREDLLAEHLTHFSQFHLVIPYRICSVKDKNIFTELRLPFFDLPKHFQNKIFSLKEISVAIEKGILEKIIEGDIIITHVGMIVDYCRDSEIEKYDFLY